LPEPLGKPLRDRGGNSLFLKFVESLGARPSRDAILAAISTTIAWGPLMRKRSRASPPRRCPGICVFTA
jgi:hypothetical protein